MFYSLFFYVNTLFYGMFVAKLEHESYIKQGSYQNMEPRHLTEAGKTEDELMQDSLAGDEVDPAEEINSENEMSQQDISDFAFKLVNSVKSMNMGEISYHELAMSFTIADELKCLFLFIKSLPFDPIAPIYPETPFLFFKGVPLPRAFDISEETARDIQSFMRSQNSNYYEDLHLHDLSSYHLDAYETAIRIYNDTLEKTRRSYHENVKIAKSQVFEVSAVMACLLVIVVVLLGIS